MNFRFCRENSQSAKAKKAKVLKLLLKTSFDKMFSFKKSERVDAVPYIRRLVDITTPNLNEATTRRVSRRYNRTIPVAIANWVDGDVDMSEVGFGFTADISDQGFCIVTQFKPKHPENVLAFYVDNPEEMVEPWCFKVMVASYRKEPCGFHRIGYTLEDYLTTEYRRLLEPLNKLVVETFVVE